MTYLKEEIIARLNKNIGEELITDIYLKAGSSSIPVAERPPTTTPCRIISTEEQQLIQDHTASISDPELKLLISSLMGKHLERN